MKCSSQLKNKPKKHDQHEELQKLIPVIMANLVYNDCTEAKTTQSEPLTLIHTLQRSLNHFLSVEA